MEQRQYDIDERLIDFAVAICEIVKKLPTDRLGLHIAGQLVRSGTAPAAHYAEARGAESRRDFIHKLKLALKELRESLVWLRISQRMELDHPTELQAVSDECDELVAIFVTSIRTTERNRGVKR